MNASLDCFLLCPKSPLSVEKGGKVITQQKGDSAEGVLGVCDLGKVSSLSISASPPRVDEEKILKRRGLQLEAVGWEEKGAAFVPQGQRVLGRPLHASSSLPCLAAGSCCLLQGSWLTCFPQLLDMDI